MVHKKFENSSLNNFQLMKEKNLIIQQPHVVLFSIFKLFEYFFLQITKNRMIPTTHFHLSQLKQSITFFSSCLRIIESTYWIKYYRKNFSEIESQLFVKEKKLKTNMENSQIFNRFFGYTYVLAADYYLKWRTEWNYKICLNNFFPPIKWHLDLSFPYAKSTFFTVPHFIEHDRTKTNFQK